MDVGRRARRSHAGPIVGAAVGVPVLVGLLRPVFGFVGLRGDSAWVLSVAAAGILAGAAVFFVSRRGQAERERADGAAHFRALLDMAPAAIMVRTPDGVIEYWNEGAEHLYGWSADEAVGKSSHQLLGTIVLGKEQSGTGGEKARLTALAALSRGAWQGELSHLTKSGNRIPVRSQWAVGTSDPVADAVIEINVDISTERAREAELREQAQEIAAAGHIDRIGSRVMTAFNRNSAATEAATDALEVLADEVGYKPLALYEYDEWQSSLILLGGLALGRDFDRRTYPLGTGLVGKAAAAQRPEFLDGVPDSTWALDTGTGDLPAATVFAIPLMFRDQLLGCLAGASAIPLSERERSWLAQIADQMAVGLRSIQQLTQLKSLSAELRDRSRRIELQNVELAEASRLKSDFLSSMSHELRTPLNAIIGFSEVLKDGLLGELPAEQLDYTTEIYNAGQHLLSLINDILDLSKIEAGKMELEIEPVQLAPLVENSLTIVKGLAAANGVELGSRLDPAVTTVEADARKLRQIVYNLLSNAVKFTPSGGNVDVEVVGRESDVEIAVTDTGIGISPAEQNKLFVAFEQLDSGVNRRFEGTGLGLATVKKLAELHGGTVGVTSEVGRGSRFWVRIPRNRAHPAPSGGIHGVAAAPSTATGTVLVIESDDAEAEFIRQSLAQIGLDTVTVADPVDTQALADGLSFRAVVLDLERCASDEGLTFLAERRSDSKLADVPMIALSRSDKEPLAVNLGAVRVLPHPIDEGALIGALRSLGIGLTAEQSSRGVLVVDDDPKAVSYVCKVLEAAGLNTSRAYGGQEALDAIAASSVDGVVLDLMMPEVSGFDVLLQLRAEPATRSLPVVVLTAKSLTRSEKASLQQMASAVVEKSRWRGSRFAEVVVEAIKHPGGETTMTRTDAPTTRTDVTTPPIVSPHPGGVG